MYKDWTYQYVRENLVGEGTDDQVWILFTDFFRNYKGYSDWTDEEINWSMNDDDIDKFFKYLKEDE